METAENNTWRSKMETASNYHKKLHDLREKAKAALADADAYAALVESMYPVLDQEVNKMTKAERIEATWKLPELPKPLYEMTKDLGFMTGSTVYGNGAVPNDEDWCIVMPPARYEGYALCCTNPGYWASDKFTAIYAHHGGHLINIICMSDYRLYEAWYYATEFMKVLNNIEVPVIGSPPDFHIHTQSMRDLAVHKWQRVRIFRALADVFWPVKEAYSKMDLQEALAHLLCVRCHREAIHFNDKMAKDVYQESGLCQRCQEEA